MNTTLTINTLAKTLTALLVASLLGGCVAQAEDAADVGAAQEALSLHGHAAWSGLPMACDGADHTVSYTTSKGTVASLVLSAASPTATKVKVVSSEVAGGFTVAGMGGASLSIGMPAELAGSTSRDGAMVMFLEDVELDSSSGKLTLSMPDGSYSVDYGNPTLTNTSDTWVAPATTLCQ